MRQGDAVRFIPPKAGGDPHHPDCDNGLVVGVGESHLFIAFPGQFLAEPVDPRYLVPMEGI